MQARVVEVVTPVGVAQARIERPPGRVRGLLVVGHGAGGDIDAPDLRILAAAALRAGLVVAGVRQPYRVAGRRAPAPAGRLDQAWLAVIDQLRAQQRSAGGRELPIALAGRSSGARVACRTARSAGARCVLALAFPLHPPGRPDRSRAAELDAGVGLLVLQGAGDPFGRPAEFPAGVPVWPVEGVGHELAGRPRAAGGPPDTAFEAVAGRAVEWVIGQR